MPYKDKKKQAESARKHYEKFTEKMKLRGASHKIISRRRNRQFVYEYLLEHPCIDCGITDIRVLEFDHVRGTKTREICDMVQAAMSIKNIALEIEKCEVRCANCHRIVTIERRTK